jgi:hypothetical protein
MSRLKFNVYYPHNIYFLIDNLSGWSIHCRLSSRKYFPEVYEFLKKDLVKYARIRKKYGWGKNSLELLFLEPNLREVKENLTKLPKKERIFLLNMLEKLNKLYGKELNSRFLYLQPKVLQLNREWSKFEKDAIAALERFSDLNFPKKISVFVLFRQEGSGGGANIGNKGITIEIGNSPVTWSVETLIHELSHYLENINDKSTRRRLADLGVASKGELNDAMLANEAITGLLAPNGFLSEKLGLSKFNFEPWRKADKYKIKLAKFKHKLRKLVKDYFENKKGRNYWRDFLPEIAKAVSI